MKGLYFSGTGNTKYCVEQFLQCAGNNNGSVSIEQKNLNDIFSEEDIIVFGYPTCFSNIPKIVHDFILEHKNIFVGKKVFIIVTMGLFSGDGSGCSARLLKKCGAKIIGGLHLQMPDCIGDEKMLKKSLEENKMIIKRAKEKIQFSVKRFTEGNPTKEGLSILYHIAGLFGQRLWFYGKSTTYKNKPDIDYKKCTGCGLCVTNCPMNNLEKIEGKIISKKRCTMCYRCVNHCPKKALTILGKNIYEQCYIEKYIK
jgi:Pyruvate/2-oxoacid:ferredoxin oxidoreductase delta subunit/flavodoxin